MVLRRILLALVFCLVAIPGAASAARAPKARAASHTQPGPTLMSRAKALLPWSKPAAAQPKKRRDGDSLAERMTDVIGRSTGNFGYIAAIGSTMLTWMAWNALSDHPIDPIPFVGLNTFISFSTWAQQGFLQMSQNRQAALDRKREDRDHQINLQAEREVRHLDTEMRARFDAMQRQIAELTALVQSMKQDPPVSREPSPPSP